ncbi:hypothetical protein [Tateyamaria sp.]
MSNIPHFVHRLEFADLLEFSFSTENKMVKIGYLGVELEDALAISEVIEI